MKRIKSIICSRWSCNGKLTPNYIHNEIQYSKLNSMSNNQRNKDVSLNESLIPAPQMDKVLSSGAFFVVTLLGGTSPFCFHRDHDSAKQNLMKQNFEILRNRSFNNLKMKDKMKFKLVGKNLTQSHTYTSSLTQPRNRGRNAHIMATQGQSPLSCLCSAPPLV